MFPLKDKSSEQKLLSISTCSMLDPTSTYMIHNEESKCMLNVPEFGNNTEDKSMQQNRKPTTFKSIELSNMDGIYTTEKRSVGNIPHKGNASDDISFQHDTSPISCNSTKSNDNFVIAPRLNQHILFELIVSNQVLLNKFVHGVTDNSSSNELMETKDTVLTNQNEINWNHTTLKKWMADAQDLLRNILFLIHISSGQPARGEELSTFQIANKTTNMRSLYVINNRLCLVQTYYKMRAIHTIEQNIARFLPTRLSSLVASYLLYIRPMETFVASILNGKTSQATFQTYLFVRATPKYVERYTGSQITEAFTQKYFEMDGQEKITINEYRHVATALCDHHIKSDCNVKTNNAHLQAGHTSSVASTTYAVSSIDLRCMNRELLRYFESLSMQWHVLIGAEENKGNTDQLNNQKPMSIMYHNNDKMTDYDNITNVDNGNKHTIFNKKGIVNNIIHTTTTIHNQSYSDNGNSLVFDQRAILLSMKGLKSLYNEHANFSCIGQAQAVAAVIHGTKSLIVHLPTGAGKSTVIFAPLKVVDSGVVVLIVPLHALQTEICNRASEFGINYKVWKRSLNYMDAPSLVIASVEGADTTEFVLFVKHLFELGQLQRIIVDEAHLIVTATYRKSMQFAERLRAMCDIQLVLMSATINWAMEREFTSKFSRIFHKITGPVQHYNQFVNVIHVQIHQKHQARVKYPMLEHLTYLLEQRPKQDRMIVFCLTRNDVHKYWNHAVKHYSSTSFFDLHKTSLLNKSKDVNKDSINGICAMFHAGIHQTEKENVLEQFIKGKVLVVFATTGFGAGIDVSDVRHIVHMHSAYSLVDYVQEIGRGGRDKKGCTATLLFDASIDSRANIKGDIVVSLGGVDVMKYAHNNTNCRHKQLTSAVCLEGLECLLLMSKPMCDVCKTLCQSNIDGTDFWTPTKEIGTKNIPYVTGYGSYSHQDSDTDKSILVATNTNNVCNWQSKTGSPNVNHQSAIIESDVKKTILQSPPTSAQSMQKMFGNVVSPFMSKVLSPIVTSENTGMKYRHSETSHELVAKQDPQSLMDKFLPVPPRVIRNPYKNTTKFVNYSSTRMKETSKSLYTKESARTQSVKEPCRSYDHYNQVRSYSNSALSNNASIQHVQNVSTRQTQSNYREPDIIKKTIQCKRKAEDMTSQNDFSQSSNLGLSKAMSKNMLCSPSNLSQSELTKRQCMDMRKYTQIVFKVETLLSDIGDHCAVCYYNVGTRTNHTLQQCPLVRTKCIGCMGNECQKKCGNRLRVPEGHCYFCMMPLRSPRSEPYHSAYLDNKCTMNGRDRILPLAWLYCDEFHDSLSEELGTNVTRNRKNVAEWMVTVNEGGLLNALDLVARINSS